MKKLQQFPEVVNDYFLMDGGVLVRKLASGALRPVSTFYHDQLIVTFSGEIYPASSIAWLVHYGIFPTRELVFADGNPYNLRKENLLPVRVTRYRCRPVHVHGGYIHKLSSELFLTREECAADWSRVSIDIYRQEKHLVVLEEAQLSEIRRANAVGSAKVKLPPKAAKPLRQRLSERPERPSKAHIWHIKTEQWVLVPPACCTADDQQVRAGYVLQGFTKFAYDAEQARVLPVG